MITIDLVGNGLNRCSWVTKDQIYIDYHDKEWGVPVYEDHKIFEFLILEGAQAGLSWLTILKKRENYRRAYDYFNPELIANYDEEKKNELLINEGIVRNKLATTTHTCTTSKTHAGCNIAISILQYLRRRNGPTDNTDGYACWS